MASVYGTPGTSDNADTFDGFSIDTSYDESESTIDRDQLERLFAESNTGTFLGFTDTADSESDVGNLDDFPDSSSQSSGSDIDIDLSGDSDESDASEDIGDNLLNDDQLREYEPNWTNAFTDFTVLPYTQNAGGLFPRHIAAHRSLPIEYFSLLFSDVLIDEIVQNTNGYADWVFGRGLVTYRWKETDKTEIKAFLGLAIIFGLIPVKCYKTYWNNDSFLGNAGIKSVMTRKRYEQLNRFFHVSDRSKEVENSQVAGYDRLYKVRNVINTVSRKIINHNIPTAEQSIDEGMIAFKGRISYLQYMPAKVIFKLIIYIV